MEITGLKRENLPKTGQKALRSKFVGATGHDDQNKDQFRSKLDVWSRLRNISFLSWTNMR